MSHRNRVYLGSCETMAEIPDGVVQTVVTSPPYYGMRLYNGEPGMIGLEGSLQEWADRLVGVFREVWRVLRPDGTCWVNLGDAHNAGAQGGTVVRPTTAVVQHGGWNTDNRTLRVGMAGLKPKDLIGMPWTLAFALRADGWYLRSDIIWAKPAPMPESMTDRPTRSHDYIFLLSKNPRYYYDEDAIREERADGNEELAGAKRRDVWTISSSGYAGAHFATFPEELVRRCLLAGSSDKGACAACGAPWARILEPPSGGLTGLSGGWKERFDDPLVHFKKSADYYNDYRPPVTVGWKPGCSCDAGVVPCLVMDPFMGSGTTAAVAVGCGRDYVGYEISPEYHRLIEQRLGLFFTPEPDPNRIEQEYPPEGEPMQLSLL